MATHSPSNPPDSLGPEARKPLTGNDREDPAIDLDGGSDGSELTGTVRPEVRMGGDIGFDRVVGPDEAGLGRGLDQAEEAQLGITDEELAELLRRRSTSK